MDVNKTGLLQGHEEFVTALNVDSVWGRLYLVLGNAEGTFWMMRTSLEKSRKVIWMWAEITQIGP
jgi:hypothetical protein